MTIKIDKSFDGLTATGIETLSNGVMRSVTLSWKNENEVPNDEKLEELFQNYFDNIIENDVKKSHMKDFKLPFDKSASVGYMDGGNFDEAMFSFGKLRITFPVTRKGEILFKSPKFNKEDEILFGVGGKDKAAFLRFKNDKNN